MKDKADKKILIIGADAAAYTLAKKMNEYKEISQVFVAPGNDAINEFCTVVDIRENNIQELLEFVLENDISLTIASSESAIKSDVVSIFQKHNQMIFGPTAESANICLSKSAGKKFMYKTRIPHPKFGIFDKESMALEYVAKSNMPIVLKTDEHQEKGILVCSAASVARGYIEEAFATGEKKVIIEDYIHGHEFSFYVITDGYHALPLGSVATYKNELEGNGGLITSGMGSYTPDYKISKQTEQKIMQQIIDPTLKTLARQQTPYVGILGVDLIMNENEHLFAIEFNPFLLAPDCQGILALLNENLYNLFQACVIGSFADDFDRLDISDNYAASCTLLAKKSGEIIHGLDDLDENTQVAHFNTKKNIYLEYETAVGRNLVLTRTARILSKAVEDLYDELSAFGSDLKYRKDIAKI